MAILLILFSLILSYILFSSSFESKWYYNLLNSLIFNSLLIVTSSEILSLFNQFNYQSISMFWLLIILFQIFLVYKKRDLSPIKNSIQQIADVFKSFKISYLFLTVFVLLLFQGLAYPPNNWDSLTYHMARIPHWVENESIHSFTTHIYRQIYSPSMSNGSCKNLSVCSGFRKCNRAC